MSDMGRIRPTATLPRADIELFRLALAKPWSPKLRQRAGTGQNAGVGQTSGQGIGWAFPANRFLDSSLVDEFDKAMGLLVLFGFGLAAYLAYGSWRLDQIRAERRSLAAGSSLEECSRDTRL